MKTINIQETIKCQDSRNVLIQLGVKTINGIGAMVHPTSPNDLQSYPRHLAIANANFIS